MQSSIIGYSPVIFRISSEEDVSLISFYNVIKSYESP